MTSGITNAAGGTISGQLGGIVVDAIGVINSSAVGPGITNDGEITSQSGDGISVQLVSKFVGGINNSGTILAGQTGIGVLGTSTFSGGVSSNGTISAGGVGILVGEFNPGTGTHIFLGGVTTVYR